MAVAKIKLPNGTWTTIAIGPKGEDGEDGTPGPPGPPGPPGDLNPDLPDFQIIFENGLY